MNVSEAIKIIQDNKGANNIFRKSLVQRMRGADFETAKVFYNDSSSRDIWEITENEKKLFHKFSVQYTGYVLSTYSGRKMNQAIKNCSMKDLEKGIFRVICGMYVHQKIFRKIAVSGYWDLGLKAFMDEAAENPGCMKNKIFFQMHKNKYLDELMQLIFLLREVNPQAANEVEEAWTAWYEKEVEHGFWDRYYVYDWIGSFRGELEKGSIYNSFFEDIKVVCEKHTTRVEKGRDYFVGGYPISSSDTVYYCYEKAVGEWLKHTGKDMDIFTGKEPVYEEVIR